MLLITKAYSLSGLALCIRSSSYISCLHQVDFIPTTQSWPNDLLGAFPERLTMRENLDQDQTRTEMYDKMKLSQIGHTSEVLGNRRDYKKADRLIKSRFYKFMKLNTSSWLDSNTWYVVEIFFILLDLTNQI